MLLSQFLLLGAAAPASAQVRTISVQPTTTTTQTTTAAPQKVPVEAAAPAATATVNLKELSDLQSSQPASANANGALVPQYIHSPITPNEEGVAPVVSGGNDEVLAGPPATAADDDAGTLANGPSPAASSSFIGESDIPKFGTSSIVIPPDTNGAVGLDKVFATLNNNYVVQNKLTGATLSRVSMDSFWAPTGATGLFDPKTIYDPYNNRWIVSAVSDSNSANSSVLVGVSQTSDPQGTYFLARYDVDSTNANWADFPTTGFNKNFIAIGLNMIRIVSPANVGAKVLVVDYPALRAGANNAAFVSSATDFVLSPAATYDPNEGTLYVVKHLSSGSGTYRLDKLTGSFATNNVNYTLGATKTNGLGGWAQPGGQNLPQAAPLAGTSSCGATPCRLEAQDSQIRNNPVFRNGNIYYTQSIGLPATGTTHYSVQWSRINTNGDWQEGARVDDPTATQTNGGKWYSYPSIAVNKHNDVLLGYSQFASNQYPSAGYSFHFRADAAGTMRDPVIYKAGEDYYNKTFGSGRNRWGDYSATQVDPSNDRDMWTLQEYAMLRAGVDDGVTGSNSSRWSTWWAKVSAPAGLGDLVVSEYRTHGPQGSADEFVEIYNTNNSPLTVQTLDGTAGYAVVSSDAPAAPKFVIPNGTVIPGRGHYLGTNGTCPVGVATYSLCTYPAGTGTATGDDDTATTPFIVDIPDNAGVALFNSATTFDTTTRLDSVGSASTPAGLFKEGAGVPDLVNFAGTSQYSYFRKLTSGVPQDTQDNAADFLFVDTLATCRGASCASPQNNLGAPGPENLNSPLMKRADNEMMSRLIDPAVFSGSAPNRVRDSSPAAQDCATNSCLGTLSIRRTFVNNTGAPVTRLRFRVVDITTLMTPIPAGTADMRARTNPSPTFVVTTSTGPVTVQRTEVEGASPGSPSTAEPAQPLGGGYNTSMSVTLAAPIAPGGSVNVEFLLGVMQSGTFRFIVIVEALP
jgi:hypothetical protein